MSGWLLKIAIVVGAAALGVEYGRRHPHTPWRDLFELVQSGLRKGPEQAAEAPTEATTAPPTGFADCSGAAEPAQQEMPPGADRV